MSAPKCQICRFDPLLDTPRPELSSTRQINIVQQTRDPIKIFLKLQQKGDPSRPEVPRFVPSQTFTLHSLQILDSRPVSQKYFKSRPVPSRNFSSRPVPKIFVPSRPIQKYLVPSHPFSVRNETRLREGTGFDTPGVVSTSVMSCNRELVFNFAYMHSHLGFFET